MECKNMNIEKINEKISNAVNQQISECGYEYSEKEIKKDKQGLITDIVFYDFIDYFCENCRADKMIGVYDSNGKCTKKTYYNFIANDDDIVATKMVVDYDSDMSVIKTYYNFIGKSEQANQWVIKRGCDGKCTNVTFYGYLDDKKIKADKLNVEYYSNGNTVTYYNYRNLDINEKANKKVSEFDNNSNPIKNTLYGFTDKNGDFHKVKGFDFRTE